MRSPQRVVMLAGGAASRSEQVKLRLSPGEEKMIKRIAEEEGLTISSFVRDAALDRAREIIEARGEEPEA